MANAKKLGEVNAQMMAVLKTVALGNPVLTAQIAEIEKVVNEAMGERAAIGPCFVCKKTESVSKAKLEIRKSRWFTCPHSDTFCPDCLKAEFKKARGIRLESKKEAKGKKK